MIRRSVVAAAFAVTAAVSVAGPAFADTPAAKPSAEAPAAQGSTTYPLNFGSLSPQSTGINDGANTGESSTGSLVQFFSEIKPGDVASVFKDVVGLVSSILGFVGHLV